MDFIKQAFKVKHEFWRYLIGSLIIAIFAVIGQVPFTIADSGKNLENVRRIERIISTDSRG